MLHFTVECTYPSFDETLYLAVSNEVKDVFASIHRPPSAYRSDLNNRVIADVWYSGPSDTYAREKSFLERFKDLGMDNLAVIIQHWQNCGYGCGQPSSYPADPRYGTDAEFQSLVNTARNFGWRIGLREAYDGFDELSRYWPAFQNDIARNPDGSLKRFNFPGPPAYVPAFDKVVNYAQQEAPRIRNAYGPNASLFDVTTTMIMAGSSELNWIDYSSTNPNARSWRQVIQHLLNLKNTHHAIYQGPIWGEGSLEGSPEWQQRSVVLLAGGVDGIEAQVTGTRSSVKIIPDFELREVKPLTANQGMGYHIRWEAGRPWAANPQVDTFEFDPYRATAIAFGHTGYMGGIFDNTTDVIKSFYRYFAKEYYIFRDLQSQYLASSVTSIMYRTPSGSFVDLSDAFRQNLDFHNAQLHITYQNGLEIYVNRSQSQQWAVSEGGQTYYLPPNGWVAVNPGLNYLNYSALVDGNGNPSPSGHRVDFVRSASYTMADARGISTNFGAPIGVAAKLKVVKTGGWTLAENADGSISTPDIPTPSVTSLSPTVVVNTAPVEVTVTGANFERYALIAVNGSPALPLTYVNAQTVKFTVAAGTPAFTYQIGVSNQTSGLLSNALALEVRTAQQSQTPAAPTNLAATAVSQTQINLSWTDNATNETGFKVERSTSQASGFAQIGTTAANVTTFSDTGLTANTTYYYRVRATNTAGDSDYSNTANATTQAQAPGFNFSLSAGGDRTVVRGSPVVNTVTTTLTSGAAQAVTFSIAGLPSGVTASFAPTSCSPTCQTTVTLAVSTGASLATTRLTVTAAGGGVIQTLAFNLTVSATPPPPVPLAPSGLGATAFSGREIRLTWADNATNETRFELERRSGSEAYTVVAGTLAPNTTSYTDTSLTPDTLYTYRIRAANAAGASNYSNEFSVRTLPEDFPPPTPTPTPSPASLGAPANLRITARSATRADFSWTDNATSEQGFKLEYSSDGVNFREVATLPANYAAYAYDRLTPGSLNYYRIRAYRGVAFSGYSNIVTVRMPSLPVPTGPFTETLKRNLTHPQIRLLQEFLSRDRTLYPEGVVSGFFGGLTEAAVKRFQDRHNLITRTSPFYGVVEETTRVKLNALYGAGPTPSPPPPPPPPGGVFTRNLSYGSSDPQVKLLQEFLAKDPAIYPEGIVSGRYLGLSQLAVQRFQAKYGIVSSGNPATTGYGAVGPRTRVKLNDRYAAGGHP